MRLMGKGVAFVAIVMCLVFAADSFAQTQLIARVGGTSNGSGSRPFYYGTSSMRAQWAFTATEIANAQQALANGGRLEEIRIRRYSGTTNTNFSGFQLRLGTTTRTGTNLSNSVTTNYTGNAFQAYGPQNLNPQRITSNGYDYFRFPCTNAYAWNGQDNLLIDMAWNSMSGYWYSNYGSGRTVRFQYGSGANTTSLNSTYTAANYSFELVFNVKGITVTTTAGTTTQAYANEQGTNGNGLSAGTFELAAGAASGISLTGIELEEVGTANAANAIQQVAIFRDAQGGTQGAYDPGDTQIGSSTTFNGANGTASFTVQQGEQSFSASETRDYFIVLWLSGSGVPGETLDFIVSDISVDNTSYKAGVPSNAMTPILGVTIRAPDMVVTDASAPTPGTAYVQLAGNVLQAFQITYAAGPANTVATVQIEADGTGNDQTDYQSLDLYVDTNQNNLFDQGQDALASSGGAIFTADNGTAQFALTQQAANFPAGTSRLFFVVASYETSTVDGSTFQSRVNGLSGTLPGTNVVGVPAPAAGAGYLGTDYNAGLAINATGLIISALGPNIAQNNAAVNVVDNDSQGPNGFGEDLYSFELFAANENWTINDVTFSASGTGNDASAYQELALYEDVNLNGNFDGPGVDTLATTALGMGFASDNGLYTATLVNSAQAQNTTRRFFLRGSLAGTAVVDETFNVRLEAVNATTAGTGGVIGAPATESLSLEIADAEMVVTNNGPTTAQAINADSIGSLGYGVMILDFSLACRNDAFTVSSVDITAAGSGNDVQAFNEVVVYEDTNGNGIFDGAGADGRASNDVYTRFPVDNGTLRFNLTNQQLMLNQTRQFFVMVKMAGTALGGDSFAARVSGVSAQAQTAGTITGVPTADSAGVVIAQSALSVGASPLQGNDETVVKTGQGFSFELGVFRLSVSNGDATVTGLNLTTGGTGEWFLDIAQNNGVELWLDDGNGAFDASTDSLLYSGGGNSPTIMAAFGSALDIPNSQFRDIFVMLNVNGTAGGSLPRSFELSVASTNDVFVTSQQVSVAKGMPDPTTRTLSVIDFRVTNMSPTSSYNPGGAVITLQGSGLVGTTALLIGGVPCGGTPDISPDGTVVTGFIVPRGKGANKEVVLTTNLLGTVTLPITFNYLGGEPLDGGGSSSVEGSGSIDGCSLSGSSQSYAWLILLAMGGALVALRRRQA